MAQHSIADKMGQVVRAYFKACYVPDAKDVAACFCPDAVHYFPGRPKWDGAEAIGSGIEKRIRGGGGYFTVDEVLTDVARHAVALEWSRFVKDPDQIFRGLEFYKFDPATLLIREIRGYYAADFSPNVARRELADFDYAGRGYPVRPVAAIKC
jgi:methyltransferase